MVVYNSRVPEEPATLLLHTMYKELVTGNKCKLHSDESGPPTHNQSIGKS